MLKANEALSKYDQNKQLAEKYISEVIEPTIKLAMQDAKSITLKGVDKWYVGSSIRFPGWYGRHFSTWKDVTSKVVKTLEEAGYKVTKETTTAGNEYIDGKVVYTIDWSEAK